MLLLKGFVQSLSMYSAIPVPGLRWDSRADRHMLAMYPLVGLVIGGIWWGMAWLLEWLGAAALIGGAVLTAAPMLLTGFLHLDGFMDVCDAVLSRRDKARRLEILKDSHTGAFAVISFGVLLLLLFSAVQALFADGRWGIFLLVPVLSRGWSGLGLLRLPLMEGSSMGAWARKDTNMGHTVFLGLCALLAAGGLGTYGLPGVAAVIAGTAAYWIGAGIGLRQLGGVNGDVCGYALCLCEAAALLAAALVG